MTTTRCGLALLGLLSCFSGACATTPATAVVDGVSMPRPTLQFTGQPYTVRHNRAHPRPGGPSSGLRTPGGDITGTVCGADIDYEVYHRGDHVQLVGLVDPGGIDSQGRIDSQVRIEDARGMRQITGQLGTKIVDVRLASNAIGGAVGRDRFVLAADGDAFHGEVVSYRYPNQRVPVTVTGREALWQMPAADQAAVVPLLIQCLFSDLRFQFNHAPPPVGFGGPATAMPRGTISLHSH